MKLAKKTGDILHFFYRYNLIKEKDIRMENILFGKEFFLNHMDIRSDIIFA